MVEDGGAADGGDLTLEELIASPTGGGGADNAMPDTSTLAPRQAGAAPRDMHAPLTRTSMVMRPDEIRTRERIEMFCMLCPLSRAVMSDPVVAADGGLPWLGCQWGGWGDGGGGKGVRVLV